MHGQTKQGLYLKTKTTPSALYTPWGEVRIYVGGNYRDKSKLNYPNDQFRKRLTLEFKNNTGEYRGADVAIHSGRDDASINAITAFGDAQLPEPILQEPGSYLEGEKVKTEWQHLMDRFSKDSAEQHALTSYKKSLREELFSRIHEELKTFNDNEIDPLTHRRFKERKSDSHFLAAVLTTNADKPYEYCCAYALADKLKRFMRDPQDEEATKDITIQEITVFHWNSDDQCFARVDTRKSLEDYLELVEDRFDLTEFKEKGVECQ